MATKTVTYYLHATENKFSTERETYFAVFSQQDMSEHGYVLVKALPLTYDEPEDFDIRPHMVQVLDKQIEKARADFAARITELQEQRSKLLCIEMAEVA